MPSLKAWAPVNSSVLRVDNWIADNNYLSSVAGGSITSIAA